MTTIQNHFCLRNVNINDVTKAGVYLTLSPVQNFKANRNPHKRLQAYQPSKRVLQCFKHAALLFHMLFNLRHYCVTTTIKPSTENVNIRHLVCKQKLKQQLVPVELFVKCKCKQFLFSLNSFSKSQMFANTNMFKLFNLLKSRLYSHGGVFYHHHHNPIGKVGSQNIWGHRPGIKCGLRTCRPAKV